MPAIAIVIIDEACHVRKLVCAEVKLSKGTVVIDE
jgi:hypothetical protein